MDRKYKMQLPLWHTRLSRIASSIFLQRDCGLWCVLLVVCFCFSGCGSAGPFEYVKIRGKLVYDDGSPLPAEGMRLMFASDAPPVDGNLYPRVGIAYIAADGTFDSVTSYKYGDGLTPGKHKVFFETVTKQGVVLASSEYGDSKTSPLEVDTADAPLNITIPKPAKRATKKSR